MFSIVLFAVFSAITITAFMPTPQLSLSLTTRLTISRMVSDEPQIEKKETSKIWNIARLQAQAAKLKAEALEMEAQLAKERVELLSEAFKSFDTDGDGSIGVDELKLGLERVFKDFIITNEQAKNLLNSFDESKDGAIQLDEFQGPEAIKLRFEKLLREEKEAEVQAQVKARESKQEAELARLKSEELKQFQSQFNEDPPNLSDKIVSLIPYIFPLLDSIQYGRYLISTEQDNPLIVILIVLYKLYEKIPFSGLIAFIALGAFSNNLSLNRLVRFNFQQAIQIDILLIVPSLLGGVATIGLPYLGATVPEEVGVLFSTITFVVFSTCIMYSCVSSLLGVIPDKIPFVSNIVKIRVPSVLGDDGKPLDKP